MYSGKINLGILGGVVLGGTVLWWVHISENRVVLKNEKEVSEKIEYANNERVVREVVEKKNDPLVDKNKVTEIRKIIPFSSQAPLGKWDEYHQEACEETALIMIRYYLEGRELTSLIAEEEIQKIIVFQLERYGKYEDSSAEEIVELAKDFYGMHNLKVIYDFDQKKLIEYLSQGEPIIVPVAGRMLKNPNFKSPGPLYHALVLVGLENGKVITNDPGTKKGRNYAYDTNILYEAIHDFSGSLEEIEKGRKAMIVFD